MPLLFLSFRLTLYLHRRKKIYSIFFLRASTTATTKRFRDKNVQRNCEPYQISFYWFSVLLTMINIVTQIAVEKTRNNVFYRAIYIEINKSLMWWQRRFACKNNDLCFMSEYRMLLKLEYEWKPKSARRMGEFSL